MSILRSGDGPCEGYVEVYYNNKLGYVGDKFWNKETEKVVCRSTHCGTPVGVSEDVYRPKKGTVWLYELKCTGEEKNLWECPGWPGPGASFYQKPTVKKIKCSSRSFCFYSICMFSCKVSHSIEREQTILKSAVDFIYIDLILLL